MRAPITIPEESESLISVDVDGLSSSRRGEWSRGGEWLTARRLLREFCVGDFLENLAFEFPAGANKVAVSNVSHANLEKEL